MELVNTKCFEGSEDNKNRCPAVVKRERNMNEELIRDRLGDMIFLYDVIDVL